MDKHNKNNKCDEILIWGGAEWYKEKIIDMVKEINDLRVLRLLLRTIIHITEEGD